MLSPQMLTPQMLSPPRATSPFVPSVATFAAAGIPLSSPLQEGDRQEISPSVDVVEVDKHVEQLMNAMALRNSLREHSVKEEQKERRASIERMDTDPLFAEQEEVGCCYYIHACTYSATSPLIFLCWHANVILHSAVCNCPPSHASHVGHTLPQNNPYTIALNEGAQTGRRAQTSA